MIKSKLLRIFTALSIIAGMIVPQAAVSAGNVNFTDDLSTESTKLIESVGMTHYSLFSDAAGTAPGYIFDSKTYTDFAYAYASEKDANGSLTYYVEGDITGFSITGFYGSYANDGIWKISLSADNENWNVYKAYCPSKVTDGNADLTFKETHNRNIKLYYQKDGAEITGTQYSKWGDKIQITVPDSLKLPAGMKYLKIEVPEYTSAWGDTFGRTVTSVSIDYTTGFSAEIAEGDMISAGKSSFAVNFTKPVFCEDSSWLKVLTGSGSECTVTDVAFSDDNTSCTVTLSENLNEDTYSVLIGDGLKDEFGFGCNTPTLSFKAEYPGAAAEIENTLVNSMSPEFVINFDRPMNDILATDIIITDNNEKEIKVKSAVMSADKKSCTVVMDNAAEGEYTVYLGDNVTDTDGNKVKTAYRTLSVTVFVPGEKAELDGNGVIEVSQKKVEILFSGAMNTFGKDDIVITKNNIPVNGFTVSIAEDRKSAAVSFSELDEGTYYIEFTDNVTDMTYNVPVLEKYRRLEFTAIADRTAAFEIPSADYENQTLKLIFSHAMDTLEAALITIKNTSGSVVTAESIKMSGDGLSCELTFAQLPAGKYTLEFSDKYYDRVGYSISPSCRNLSFEIIDYGTSAKLEQTEVKAEDNAVTVIFGDEIAQIGAEMITVKDSFENDVVVSGIEMSEDGLKCKVLFKGLSDDSYTMYLSSGIRTATGHTVNNSCKKLVFTAKDDRAGKRIFTDDFGYAKGSPDISKVYSSSDELDIRTTTGFTPYVLYTSTLYAEKEKKYALTAGTGLVSPYVVYRTDGIISEFSIDVMYWGVSNGYHDGKFSFYISDDAENWTKLDSATEYSESAAERTNYDTNWYRKTYKSSVQLDGHNANYIKICYPTKTEGVSNNTGWSARNLTKVQLSYNYGAGSAKVRETGTQNNGKSFYADIAFMNPLNESNINPAHFTVSDSDTNCYSVSYDSDKRVLRLFFDKAFEFSKEYTLTISDEFTDEYGFGLVENSKKLTLDFSEPDIVFINTQNPFNTSEITAGKNIVCNMNLTANYAGGGTSQKITMVAVMTRDGKICAIDSDSKTLEVGSSADFSAELKAPTDITAREEVKVRVYIIDSWRNLRLLSDRVTEL